MRYHKGYRTVFIILSLFFILLVCSIQEIAIFISQDKVIYAPTEATICLWQIILSFMALASFLLYHFYNKETMKNVAIMLITFFILFLSVEVVLRAMNPQEAHDSKAYSYNKYGFMDINHTYTNINNKTRILILGDSYTFGAGLKDYENAYPFVLEKMLNSTNGKYEVMKAALSGRSTVDHHFYMYHWGVNYSTQIVILAYTMNDAESDEIRADYVDRIRFMPQPYDVIYSSYKPLTVSVIEERLTNILMKTGILIDYPTYLRHINSEASPNYHKNQELLRDIIRISKDDLNARVIVLIFPYFYRLEDYPFYDTHMEISQIAKENGAEVIDLMDHVKNYSAESLAVSKSDLHPNKFVHDMVAQILYDHIINISESNMSER